MPPRSGRRALKQLQRAAMASDARAAVAARGSLWRHAPLLLGLLLAGGSALSALTMSVNQPAYEFLLGGALVAGLATSALGLWRGRVILLPGALVMMAGLSLFVLRVAQLPIVYLLYPPEVMADEDLLLATMVGWLLVAFSFWQSSRAYLIFLIVAGLAIFGLMGTVNLNFEMRVAFALFVLGAVFCWSYEQFLNLDDRLAARGQPRVADWPTMARGHLSIAVLVAVLTYGFGSLIGTGAYRVSPNLYATMAREMYGWNPQLGGARQLFNGFETQFNVGTGPVRLLPVPVMEVQAERGALWRGLAYDAYNGHGWSRSMQMRSAFMTREGDEYRAPAWATADMEQTTPFTQRVTVTGNLGPLCAAAQPETFRLEGGGSAPGGVWGMMAKRIIPLVDVYGCLSGAETDAARQYTVVSREPISDPASLRAAPVSYDAFTRYYYLGVPDQTKAALGPVVEKITAGSINPYDKVQALRVHLQHECAYSLGAAAVPRGEDAAAYFVLHSRRGACDLFATALVMMSRLAGVPARVATGYQTGEYDEDKQAFVVLGTDAHAWAEVYFPGHGWVAFDTQAEEVFETLTLTQLLERGQFRWVLRSVGRRAVWVVALTIIALLALAALVDPLRVWRSLWRPRPRTPLERLSREYQGFYEWLLRRKGLRPSPALTPQEAMRWSIEALGARGVAPETLMRLNERFYGLRYAAEAPEGEIEELRGDLKAMRQRLRRR